MTLDRREVVTIDVPVSLTTLWSHLRDPALIRRWYRSDRPSLDDEIEATFVRQPHEFIDADAKRVEHRLVWPHGDVLTIAAENHSPHHCAVSFTRASYQGLHTNTYDGLWDVIDELWVASLHQLAFAVTVHRDEERRTLAVEGLDAGERGNRLLDRAGLNGVRGVPVGAHVEGVRPDGIRLGGTVMYKTPHQFGIDLHGIGEHMIVVYELPVGERPPNGEVGAVLSTWGLDDAQFAQVKANWEAWWHLAVAGAGAGVTRA
jgi:hypothetical protein